MSSRFAVLCLLLLHYFIGSVDGFQKTLTTSGRDVTYELKTSVPVNLYGEYHKSLFIHSSGYIALGESDVKRIDVNRFQQDKLIVPFYNQIYLRKTVLIQTIDDTVLLNDFSRTVRTHFSEENTFQADQIISITWSVYATFAQESMQTLTLLIGSNKDTSYVEIKYEHSKSKLYENFLYFVYGTPIAGFSAGDGVRYHRIYKKAANELFTDVLSKLSNIASPGRWLFKLGGVGGSNSNFAIGLPDSKLESGNVVDNDECAEGVSQCHEFATCSNRNLGYICQCNEGYFGNGKVCLPKGSRVYVRGSITGTMNGHSIPNSDNTILVQPEGVVAVTVIPLKEDLGHTFRLLPMIHGLMPWLFAKSDSNSNGKGFDIVGDRIIAKTLINFIEDPGELYVTQKTMGFKNGGLALHTEISGSTPDFGPIRSFDISGITEDFAESNVGTTSSISHPTIRVNGKEYKVKVSRLILYEPSLKKMSDLKHQLHITFDSATYSSYSTLSGLYMKFNAFIKNMKDDGTRSVGKTCKDNPCGANSKCRDDNGGFTCDCVSGFEKRGSLCVDIDECATGRACSSVPNTRCVNRDGSYQCVCDDGYQRTAQGCVAVDRREVGSDCRNNPCGPNSNCAENNGVYSCQCKPGFEKQRSVCVDIDECRTGRACSSVPNTKCINREGSYQCECVEGYRRTAAGCEVVAAEPQVIKDCRDNPCGANSECVESNGVYSCQCASGFRKQDGVCVAEVGKRTCRDSNCGANSKCVDRVDGFECVCDPGFEKTAAGCQDIDECASGRACVSVPNTKCENRIGAYTCVCKIGYKRTANGCVDIHSSATCRDKPCGDNARCVDTAGGYECRCEPGFKKEGSECVDIDECAIYGSRACGSAPNTNCENRPGTYRCVCKDGFKRTARGCEAASSCRDNPCGPNSYCVDENGGSTCYCNKGYKKHGSLCVDIDECATSGICDRLMNSRCVNSEGSYECKCKDGYVRNQYGCKADDRRRTCANVQCGKNSKCVDRPEGYTCICDIGFEKTGPNSDCEDIDECETPGICQSEKNSKCENRDGSYECVCKDGFAKTSQGCKAEIHCKHQSCGANAKCVRSGAKYKCECDRGFEKKGLDCVDTDECATGRACLNIPNTRCENRIGAYTCVCIAGFKRTAEGCVASESRSCRDNPCGANSRCIQEVDTFRCECNNGFRKSGSGCVDINECETPGICQSEKNTKCENRVGSYECVCKDGFAKTSQGCKAEIHCKHESCGANAKCVRSGATYKCECDRGFEKIGLDCVAAVSKSCRDNPCGANAKCIDEAVGYRCECGFGFRRIGSECVDIDECSTGTTCSNVPNSKCENRLGTYACICDEGFRRTADGCVAADGRSCRDNPCGRNSKCVDQADGYRCECASGFTRRGPECVDIDECLTGRACSNVPNTKCENRVGAYACVCVEGFKRTAAGCVASGERSCRDNPCGANSKCVQEASGYKCECHAGYEKRGSDCVAKSQDCRSTPCGPNSKCMEEDGGYTCKCESGYRKLDSKCVDIDECDIFGSVACESAPNTKCENRPGTYRCVCKPGFKRTVRGCVASTICADKPCGANADCADLLSGGYKCTCKFGFHEEDSICIDINECELQDVCRLEKNTKCLNTEGRYECVCKDGFVKTALGCAVAKGCNTNPCGPHATCKDEADGTHSCTCKRGFEKRGSICADVDECSTRNACDYVENSRCINLVGSYTCVCKTGYKRTGNGCEASGEPSVDDCRKTPCGPNSKCLLSGGSYSCQCDTGYQKIGSSCVAVEDCRRRPCGANSKCEYTDGTYSCKCDDGFQKSGSVCIDINECNQDINPCTLDKNLKCENNIGSYTCVCKSGYKENEDGTCSELKCGCGENEECAIVAGQQFCRCKPGYELRGDDCVDKDECKSGDHNCPSNSVCVNTIGSYSCQCKTGYTKTGNMCVNFVRFTGMWSLVYKNGLKDMYKIKKDGSISVKSQAGRVTSKLQPTDNEKVFPTKDGWFMAKDAIRPNTWEYIRLKPDGSLEIQHFCSDGCTSTYGPDALSQYCCPGIGKKPIRDVDECKDGSHNCSAYHQCVNTIGSYRCDCKKGFKENGDNCDDIDECVYNMCGSQAKCINTAGSYICQCNAGYKKIGSVCTDINECEQDDACGKHALCINTEGGHICNCPINYVFAQNGKDCERACSRCLNGGKCIGDNQCQCPEGFSGDWCQYKTKDDFLLFAQSGSVKRLSVPYRSRHFGYLHTRYGNNIVALDYDCKDNMVFYADTSRGEIGTVTYTGLNDKVVIKGLLSPEGVTVDWLGRNVFWVDSRAKTVNVGSLDGQYTKNLFYRNIDKPRAITNNPMKGKLYWTDWYRQNPRIESSNMDGSDRKVIVNSTSVKTPNGLSINYIDNELCWTDAGIRQIACIDLGGSGNIRILVTRLLHPFSLTFHGEHIFWTDWKIDTIQRMNLKKMQRGKPLKSGISYDGQLYDIKSVQKCHRGCEEPDYDYAGFDIKVVENVNSSTECNALCKETVDCKYFTYHTKDHQIPLIQKTCALKSSNAGRVYKAGGIISGSIACDVETSNKCSHNKGGCSHLCLMKGANEVTCAQPDELNLSVSNEAS